MTESFAAVNGLPCEILTVYIPNKGPWIAEAAIIDPDAITGAVTITVGDLTLHGTVSPDAGVFREQSRMRIVGGGGGWGTVLPPKGYSNDALVKALDVAEDAAREAGEVLADTFTPERERIGSHYVRQVAAASQALEDAIGTALWWVGYDGLTYVGERPTVEVEPDAFEVLEYDAMHRSGIVVVDNMSAVGVGSILTEGFAEPVTVRDLTIRVTPADVWLEVRTDEPTSDAGRTARIFRDIARAAVRHHLHGVWKYRAVRMVGDRVELQAVSTDDGLPDLLRVEMWSAPGIHADLTPGVEVLVQFVGGDRAEPVITHFAPKGAGGFVPVSLELAGGGQRIARQGDLVQCGGVGTQVTFTGYPSPMVPGVPYLISFSTIPPSPLRADPLYGAISTGSTKVESG